MVCFGKKKDKDVKLAVDMQEYVPEHNGVASKLSWEKEQQLGYNTKSDIAR